MAGGFEELGLAPELLKAVGEQGWLLPTDVQDEAIPLLLGGGDVMVAAETGSGKTGAFALPVIQQVHESRCAESSSRAEAPPMKKKARSSASPLLSSEDRDALLAVSADGLVCQCRAERAWAGCRATVGSRSGCHCFEASVEDEGLCRVGWSTSSARLDLGTCPGGFGFGGTGKKSNSRRFETYGEAFAQGDIIGCRLDWNSRTVSFSKNGRDLGTAFELPQKLRGPLFPAVVVKNAEMRFNFGGDKPLRYPALSGATAIAAAPESELAVATSNASASSSAGAQGRRRPLALLLAPTRDLAQQTAELCEALSAHLVAPRLKTLLMVGGMDKASMQRAVSGGVDIVVGTPGRVTDFAKSGKLDLGGVRVFVLDEADRLLDDGNLPAIKTLFAKLPKTAPGLDDGGAAARLQVCFFSATLHSPEIARLAEEICHRPTWVDLKGRDSVPDTVRHLVVRVSSEASAKDGTEFARLVNAAAQFTDQVHRHDQGDGGGSGGKRNQKKKKKKQTKGGGDAGSGDGAALQASERLKRRKLATLVRVLDALACEQCLIFCRTNLDCDNLERFLLHVGGGGGAFKGKRESGKENPYSCCVVAGWRSTQERKSNLRSFKEGDVRFLICTDVAARGIDIKELPYVINLTLPSQSEDYVHRIGRVGRADRTGLALSLVSAEGCKEKVWFCQKGNRPPNCPTHLYECGGNCVWYDEPAMLKAVEKRLGGDAILALPPNWESAAKTGVASKAGADALAVFRGDYGGAARGSEEANALKEEVARHIETLRPKVATLAQMEVQVQRSWIDIARRFGKEQA